MRWMPFRELAEVDVIGWLRNAFQTERGYIFTAREAFQRLKKHFKGKEVFQGELADMYVITEAFQTVKESFGIRRPSREVAEMRLIKSASKKEAGDGKMSHSTKKWK